MNKKDNLKNMAILQAQLEASQQKLKAEVKAKEALEKKVTYLEEIISLLPGHVYWKNRAHHYQGCNDKQAKSFALSSRENIVGKTIYDLLPSKQDADDITAIDNSVMEKNKIHIEEEEVTMACGHAIYLSQKVPLHDSAGNVTGMLGVSFDISERKKMELALLKAKQRLEIAERDKSTFLVSLIKELTGQVVDEKGLLSDYIQYIREYFDNIIAVTPAYIYWKDLNGVYIGCNDQIATLGGLKSRYDSVGMTDYDFPWGGRADILIANDKEVMRSGVMQSFEEKVKNVKGECIYAYTHKTPLKNQQGEIIGILGISIDITELKKAQEQAESANRIKTEFIRNMQHDIRTPLSGLWGMAHMLYNKSNDPKQKADLNDLKMCAKELLDYCNRILDFSNVELQNLPLVLEPFSLEVLGDKIIKLESPAAHNKGLKLHIDCEPLLPTMVISDYYRLYTILINLVSNAVKFTESGDIHLRFKKVEQKKISNDLIDEKKIEFQIMVEDSGIGISEEKRLHVFEKFSKLNASNKGHYRGLGLGLSFVKQFIKDLSGSIEIESRAEGGTIFICTIPFILSQNNEKILS